MKVAIFTDNDFVKVNGVTTCLRAALAHAPSDMRLCVFTASDLGVDRPDYFAAPSVGIGIPFYREMRVYMPKIRVLLRKVREERFDLIHLTTPGPIGLAALFVARQTGLPIVGSFHTDLVAYTARLSGSSRLASFMGQYMHWLYEHCERILVPSDTTRRLVIACGTSPRKIAIWPRGVDAQLFSPARRSESLRERWRVSDRRPAIVYVGRISREKGLAILPAVQSALYRRGVEHRLILVGDGPMRRELQAQLPNAVFTGTLGREDVATAMASGDLFLFPSDTETAGNVVLEAQASGLVALVAKGGASSEYIKSNRTGFACASGDADAFGHAAARLLRDWHRRRRLSAAARAHALDLRWDAALEPLYRTYLEVGSNERTSPSAGVAAAKTHGHAAA